MGNSISRKTTLRLFADDSLLYRFIKTIDDRKQLQEDLTTLTKWAETWQMTFHPAKCYILRVTRKKTPIIENYEMMGHILSTVLQYPYLGVQLSEDLRWEPHIKKAISKENKVLGFLRRNIGKCPLDIRELQDHPETADVNSEPSVFIRILLAPRLTFAQQYLRYGITTVDQPYRCRCTERVKYRNVS